MEKGELLNDKNKQKVTKKPKCVMLEEYFNFKSYKMEFITNTMMERLGAELIAYVEGNDEVIKIKQFLALKGISADLWGDWIVKYDVLKKAHNYAKMILSNRREVGVMTRKYEPSSTQFMMPLYDSDWELMQKRKADLANKVDEGKGQQVVVMYKTPDSPMVPRIREEE